jgi:transposase-like protein
MSKVLDRSVPADAVVPAGSRAIGLGHGRYTLVDEADYALLSQNMWIVLSGKLKHDGTRYGAHVQMTYHDVDGKQRNLLMHRAIMPDAKVVDHINGNGLDNRRANLRACTQRENAANFRQARPSATGFIGVGRSGAKFTVKTTVGGSMKYIGTFSTAEEAAKARDIVALREYGAFAVTNYPISNYLEQMSKAGAL